MRRRSKTIDPSPTYKLLALPMSGLPIAPNCLADSLSLLDWLSLDCVPPGKREHVEALVHIQHFLDRRATGIAVAHPLLAQPLLEHCLRIPSRLWMAGGRDRAIARDAFAGILPPSVARRRAKGSLLSLFYCSFGRLRVELRDVLMSGALRADGILDSDQIERVFDGDAWRRDDVQLRLSEIVALELWIDCWA